LALPEDVRAEIVGGVLVALPSPLPRHARAQRALGSFVGGPFDDDDGRGGPGGWWVLLEVDVRPGSARHRAPRRGGLASRAASEPVGRSADRRRARLDMRDRLAFPCGS